ncbi:hypothetical protein LINGRAHAP2_LOCUS13131 [Linum grandiflorum]
MEGVHDTKTSNDEPTENDLGFCIISLLIVLVVTLVIFCVDYSTSLTLNPAVVSASFSSNGSHLTARWDVTLDLGVGTTMGPMVVHVDRVEASFSHSPNRSSTRLFPLVQTCARGWQAHGLQLRAEDDHFDSSSLPSIGVSVQVWTRLVVDRYSEKCFFGRLSCNPDWIGSSDVVRWFSLKPNKCQVHLIKQRKLDGKLCDLELD